MCQVVQDQEHEITAGTYYRHLGSGFGPTDVELEDTYDANCLLTIWKLNCRFYGR